MYALLITIFALIAFLQMIVILLQSSKGGGLAGTFGGAGMGSVLGSRGTATFLSKLTAGLAASFMILALILGLMKSSADNRGSLVEQERQARSSSPAAIGVPVVPGAESLPVTAPAPQSQEPAAGEQEQPE